MTELLTFFKNLPWKKWAPWLVFIILINLFVIWIKINITNASNWIIYGILILDAVIVVAELFLEHNKRSKIIEKDAIVELAKIESKTKSPTSEMTFKGDVEAENGEFGVIKTDAKINRNTKTTFEGKVIAKNGKFGNIE